MNHHRQTRTGPRPVVCAIGGIDPSGHAGLLADLRTLADLGCHGSAIPTSITLQNGHSCHSAEPLAQPGISELWRTLAADTPARAVKVGLICNSAQFEAISACQRANAHLPWVQDPVSSASQNLRVLARTRLLPGAVFTPNLPELAAWAGLDEQALACPKTLTASANKALAAGAQAVWVKGGHGAQANWVDSYFCSSNQQFWLRSPRLNAPHSRGTGCVLASSLAAFLAHGKALADAVVLAHAYVYRGLRLGQPVGTAPGPVAQTGEPQALEDFPLCLTQAQYETLHAGVGTPPFAPCPEPGLYVLVDSLPWLRRLLKSGVRTLQLRIKNLQASERLQVIKQAIALGRAHKAQVYINDYWEDALALGAYGVHLGQEDLADTDLPALARAGLRLGISCHSEYEWCRALACQPSYLALGAAFTSHTKAVPVLEPRDLQHWHRLLRPRLPVVVIGGINAHTLPRLLPMGVQSVAVINAVTRAENPEAAVRGLQSALAMAPPPE
ncbi:bifunctional hydroxymethylpyrimidine kinase/phosphomethylpyrimidine kinase [Simiduia sp. 21SJ11W-1]|uniref:bifunctional hydroxymethylpyrimidine kinase/phosphomethylpyrimidine kinase n=1 Tax=Simiduia sp. 21SJ11W-1 TaxID=2909669 RepID=UPI00209EE2B4|nr:bifunctional hydroxymethylpyrimidine kinase/phosphomethylpyrimidine kinase [Simiduia sp. 21SJ11W-1]UTA49016.1 bifunctional hydroxymethylpyrimidine kinase/phosphomethylpyrimidine kinase [Simiduia sp. 21SJ11W-1]